MFHAHYIMLDILIQINEGIAKFFTLMVKGHLNKVTMFKCNTCIILGYLHSPWNLEGYCIALPKPRRNTISTPYCDNILNHDTNESIVKLITLIVKGSESIIKMRHYNYTSKLCWVTLYHQCGQYCNTLIYIYQWFCIIPLNNFYNFWIWKCLSILFNVWLKFLT